jgi:hypothetical protein
VTRTRIISASIPAGVFIGTFLFRWVTLDFDNDYFMHVAWAAEMLRGEAPVRDFVEPGFILQTLVSYMGFRLGGYQLSWEGGFAAAVMAASATFVYLAGRRAGIPSALAVLAAVLAAVSFPRLYAYPKVVVYPAAVWALAAYFDRPSRPRLLLVSAITAVAFLFRHDHGVWIGVVVVAALCLFHRRNRSAIVAAAATYGATALLLVIPWLGWVALSGHAGQYLGFLSGQAGGLVTNRIVPDRPVAIDGSMPLIAMAPIEFPRIRIRWAADTPTAVRREREQRYGLQPLQEADEYRLQNVASDNVRALVGDPVVEDTSGIDRSSLRVPSGLFPWLSLQAQRYVPIVRLRILPGIVRSANAQAWLTYVTFLLPWTVLAAVLVSAAVSRFSPPVVPPAGRTAAPGSPLIVSAVLLSLITYQTMVRGSPDSRLGDVAPITALLLAWVVWRAWSSRGWMRPIVASAAVVLLALTIAASASYGQAVRRLGDAGIDGPTNFVRRASGVSVVYGTRPLDLFAPPGIRGLPGLARWLNECTAEHDRVSVVGFEPQLFVLAERGFAGGMAFYDLGWVSSDSDQALALARWSAQEVPVVLALESEWDSFSRDYSRIRAWIDERYVVERRSDFGGGKPVMVLRDRSRAAGSVHPATGLPCFTRP